MDGMIHELKQLGFVERLKYVDLATREERTYHLKRWVLGGRTDECDFTSFYSCQQRVLLRLGESMDFVDK